jgi:hypothetical protein
LQAVRSAPKLKCPKCLRERKPTHAKDQFSLRRVRNFCRSSADVRNFHARTIVRREDHAEFMKIDLAKGLDLLSDPLFHPTFPTAEFTKMIAQREGGILSAKDQSAGVLGTYFNASLFGANPYARPTGGDEQSLAHISRETVATFYQTYYKPPERGARSGR